VATGGNVTLNGNKSAIYGSAAVASMTTGNCSKTTMTGVTTSGGAQVTGGIVQSFSTDSNRWSTSVPKSSLTGNTFVTGVAFPVPSNFPTGIQNVAWSASFSTDTPEISLQWQWGAAVYSSFSTCYAYQNTNSAGACYTPATIPATNPNTNVLGANPEDGTANLYPSDSAGTPEAYKSSVFLALPAVVERTTPATSVPGPAWFRPLLR
jgi:hypothetical protein